MRQYFGLLFLHIASELRYCLLEALGIGRASLLRLQEPLLILSQVKSILGHGDEPCTSVEGSVTETRRRSMVDCHRRKDRQVKGYPKQSA